MTDHDSTVTSFDLSKERDHQAAERGIGAVAATPDQVRSACRSSFSQGWDAALSALGEMLWPMTLDKDEYPLPEHRVNTPEILRVLRANRIICEPDDE